MFLHALQDVLLWFPVSQLWEGAGALETAGIFTHPKRQNWIDGSLKSPQERRREERRGGGAGQEYIRLFPLARGAVTQLLLSVFSCVGYLLPKIFQFFFFTSSTLESSLLVSIVSVYRVVLLL